MPVGTADILYQLRNIHLSMCCFVDLSVQFSHQYLGKRRDVEIFLPSNVTGFCCKPCKIMQEREEPQDEIDFVSLAT